MTNVDKFPERFTLWHLGKREIIKVPTLLKSFHEDVNECQYKNRIRQEILFSNPQSENMSHIMNGKEIIKFRLVEGSSFWKHSLFFVWRHENFLPPSLLRRPFRRNRFRRRGFFRFQLFTERIFSFFRLLFLAKRTIWGCIKWTWGWKFCWSIFSGERAGKEGFFRLHKTLSRHFIW